MSSSKRRYAVLGSDRVDIVDSAISLVNVLQRRLFPEAEFAANQHELIEEEYFAYREALKMLASEFRKGSCAAESYIVGDEYSRDDESDVGGDRECNNCDAGLVPDSSES